MIDTISRVEKHSEKLDDSDSAPMNNDDLEGAACSSRDRLIHQTYQVSCSPICAVDVGIASVSIDPKDPPLLFTDCSDALPSEATAAVTPQS
jgi:hypothetical protein